jgi:hypothetical protein
MPDSGVESVAGGHSYYIFIDSSDNNKIKARSGKTGAIDFTDSASPGHANLVLQACLDALSNGGTVHIGPGTFGIYLAVSSSSVVSIIGSGKGVTTLVRNITTVSDMLTMGGSGIMVARLTIDGNYPTNTTLVGTSKGELSIGGNNVLVSDIEVKNFAGQFGIWQYGQHVTIQRCTITGVNSSGISLWGILTFPVSNPPITVISDCRIEYCSTNAIFGEGVTTMHDCYFANNCFVNGGQIGCNRGATMTNVIGCTFDPGLAGDHDYGIECQYGDWIVANNTVIGNVYGILVHNVPANPTYSVFIANNRVKNCTSVGIYVVEPPASFVITRNVAFDDQVSPTQQYGIYVEAGAADNYIIKDNICYGNALGQVEDFGTGTNKTVKDNFGQDATNRRFKFSLRPGLRLVNTS